MIMTYFVCEFSGDYVKLVVEEYRVGVKLENDGAFSKYLNVDK